MASLLESTSNTRQVVPGSFRYLRSDAPVAISAQDISFLLEHDVRWLVDLRSDAECKHRPCALRDHPGFQYFSLPVTGGNAMPASVDDVPWTYSRMVDARMIEILRTIDAASCGVMFFCTAGKDRTGVVSAILQRRAGLPREMIVADYVLSGENLREMLTEFAQKHPEIDPRIFTPQPAYMEQFLDWLEMHPDTDKQT